MAAVSAGKTSPRNAAIRQQAAAQLKGLMSPVARLTNLRAISERAMSEDKNDDPFDNIIQNDVINYLEEKGAKANCSICDKNSWTLFDNIHNCAPAIVTINKSSTIFGAPILPLVIMSCNNCGYIRSHNRIQIKNWLKSKAAENSNE